MKNKGIFIDHVEQKFLKNLENPLIYGVFCSQGEKMKNFENLFIEFKTLISQSSPNGLSSSFFCKHPHFLCGKGFCNK